MVNRNRPARPRFFITAIAAIAAAVEGALLLSKKAQAAGEAVVTIVGLSEEVMDLLSGIAQGVGSTLEKLDDIIDAIHNIVSGAPGTGGYPDNADGITATFVACPFPQPQSFRLPSIVIPKGMQLDILARNPLGVNAGIIWVSGTEVGAHGQQQARPLIAGATVSYRVKNADSIWIGATIAGEGVYISVEQNRE